MKKKIIIGSVILVVIIAFIAVSVSKNDNSTLSSGKALDVKVSKLVKNTISETVSTSGVIEEVENKDINIDTSLKVKKLLVSTYQKVVKGQKLMELDTDALKSDVRVLDSKKKIKEINDLCLSPIDGVVIDISVKEGGYINTMQPLMRIINTDKLQVRASVREMDLKKIAVGQMVRITGDSIDENENIAGKVLSIAPIAKRRQTMNGEEAFIEAIISIDKSNKLIRPGLSVNCEITTSIKENVVLASFDMLLDDKDGNKLLYVVNEADNIIREKQVKLGIASDLSVEILEGANAGDLVILNPMPSIKDGAKAKIKSN